MSMAETWRQRIERVHKAVEVAEQEREKVLAEALEAGVSTRRIAPLLGVGHSTVWRWAGGRQGARTPLDSEAG